MNNFEKIKAMNIEGMAEWLFNIAFEDYLCNEKCTAPDNCQGTSEECIYGIKEWLEAEIEEQCQK